MNASAGWNIFVLAFLLSKHTHTLTHTMNISRIWDLFLQILQ